MTHKQPPQRHRLVRHAAGAHGQPGRRLRVPIPGPHHRGARGGGHLCGGKGKRGREKALDLLTGGERRGCLRRRHDMDTNSTSSQLHSILSVDWIMQVGRYASDRTREALDQAALRLAKAGRKPLPPENGCVYRPISLSCCLSVYLSEGC